MVLKSRVLGWKGAGVVVEGAVGVSLLWPTVLKAEGLFGLFTMTKGEVIWVLGFLSLSTGLWIGALELAVRSYHVLSWHRARFTWKSDLIIALTLNLALRGTTMVLGRPTGSPSFVILISIQSITNVSHIQFLTNLSWEGWGRVLIVMHYGWPISLRSLRGM